MNETSVQFRRFSAALVAVLAGVLLTPSLAACAGTEDRRAPPKPSEVLAGLRSFLKKTARPDGSFRPGADAHYPGISDSGYSDLAPTTYAVVLHTTFGWKLPHEAKTVAWFHDRQQEHGAFINVAGTADPKSAQARLYNTTQGIVALRALGLRPRYNPLPVFEEILQQDYAGDAVPRRNLENLRHDTERFVREVSG